MGSRSCGCNTTTHEVKTSCSSSNYYTFIADFNSAETYSSSTTNNNAAGSYAIAYS
jgi:hypothetical protein